MFATSVFDTKPYDRKYLAQAPSASAVDWHCHEFRLSVETAPVASGSRAVCLFVNDRADRPCLETLRENGIELLALRCAGYNNVDLDAARQLDLPVIRVPAYSPH